MLAELWAACSCPQMAGLAGSAGVLSSWTQPGFVLTLKDFPDS